MQLLAAAMMMRSGNCITSAGRENPPQQSPSSFISKENVNKRVASFVHPRHSNVDFCALSRAACFRRGGPVASANSTAPSFRMEAVTFTSPETLAIRASGGYSGVESVIKTAPVSAVSLPAVRCAGAFAEMTNKHSAVPTSRRSVSKMQRFIQHNPKLESGQMQTLTVQRKPNVSLA